MNNNVLSTERVSDEFSRVYGQLIGQLLMEKINLLIASEVAMDQMSYYIR